MLSYQDWTVKDWDVFCCLSWDLIKFRYSIGKYGYGFCQIFLILQVDSALTWLRGSAVYARFDLRFL